MAINDVFDAIIFNTSQETAIRTIITNIYGTDHRKSYAGQFGIQRPTRRGRNWKSIFDSGASQGGTGTRTFPDGTTKTFPVLNIDTSNDTLNNILSINSRGEVVKFTNEFIFAHEFAHAILGANHNLLPDTYDNTKADWHANKVYQEFTSESTDYLHRVAYEGTLALNALPSGVSLGTRFIDSGDTISWVQILADNSSIDSANLDTLLIDRSLAAEKTITSGKGNDYIYGYTGKDTLDGGDGNDKLYGGTGEDKFTAGKGDDWFFGHDDPNGIITAPDDNAADTVDYSAVTAKIILDTTGLTTQQIMDGFLQVTDDGQSGMDMLHSIEKIMATQFDDEFILTIDLATSGLTEIDGGMGRDTVDFSGAASGIMIARPAPGTDAPFTLKSIEEIILTDFGDTLEFDFETEAGGKLVVDGNDGMDTIEINSSTA